MNNVVLIGTLSSDPKRRSLPSGDELVAYEVTTETNDGNLSVPVVWFQPSRPPAVAKGDIVAVVGHVRRRFFRTGTAAASRTEVVASVVGRPHAKRVRRSVVHAIEALATGVAGDAAA